MRKVILMAAAVLAATAALADQVIAEFTGNGTLNTRPFVVEGPWELRYEANATLIVFIRPDLPDGGGLAGTVTSPAGGTGASYQPVPGRYYLEVTGFGDWKITIVALTPEPPPPAGR